MSAMRRADDPPPFGFDGVPHVPYVSESSYLKDREYILGTLSAVQKDVGEIKTILAATTATAAVQASQRNEGGARRWALRTALLAASVSGAITLVTAFVPH